MATSQGAVVIDTQINTKKIQADFKKIDEKTKNMINRYNKSVDSIKRQELALEKVKQKLNDLEEKGKNPFLSQVGKNIENAEDSLITLNEKLKKTEDILSQVNSRGILTEDQDVFGNPVQYKIFTPEDNELRRDIIEKQADLTAEIYKTKEKLSELKQQYEDLNQVDPKLAIDILNVKTQVDNMTSSLLESKNQANQLKDNIQEAFNQKASFLGIKNGIDDVGKKIDKFRTKMTRLIGTVAVFSLMRKGLTSLRNSFASLLKTDDNFSSSLNQIKANLMTAFTPIYNACLPAINSLMNALSKITGTIAVFISSLFGKSLKESKKEAEGLSKSLEGVSKAGEEASGSLASFDNLEVINDSSSSGGNGGTNSSGIDYSGEIQYSQKLLDFLNKIKDFVVNNKELILGLFTGIAAGLLLVKLGIDGITALGIGLIITGIILLIQDVIKFLQDPTWEGFGKILTDIGIILLGLAIVIGSIPLAVAAAVALIVGLVISHWEEIMKVLSEVGGWIYKNIIKPVSDFFVGMWKCLVDGAVSAWNGIKNVFSTVATFFKNIFSNAWTAVKNVFSTGGKIFDGIKDGIVSAFKTVVNAIIGGINKVVAIPFNAINGVLNKIKNIDILGAKPFKGLIHTISVPQIPKLATGAVIPPRSEFMAILGDQKRGTNIEAPLDTIKAGVRDVLSEMGLSSNGKDLVIENLTIINRMGNTDFSKAVVKGVRIAEKDMGKPLFVN